jgi:hypothetical protein
MAQIPTVARHRGVGIHDQQSAARIKIVKRAIDRVAAMSDVSELVAFVADMMEPPEARLFAASKIEAQFELSTEERRVRPDVDMERIHAFVAGLDSVEWRDPDHFGSLLHTGQVPRGRPA